MSQFFKSWYKATFTFYVWIGLGKYLISERQTTQVDRIFRAGDCLAAADSLPSLDRKASLEEGVGIGKAGSKMEGELGGQCQTPSHRAAGGEGAAGGNAGPMSSSQNGGTLLAHDR